jgi:gluconate 5-dehydrogenase
MVENGYGKIINIASITSIRIVPGLHMVPYYVTKAGVVQFTRAASAEWAEAGICVNAISPGWFITDINRHLWENPEFKRMRLDHTPAKRLGRPEDLWGTVIYLASAASDFVTGQNIPVDGGYTVW